MPFVPVPQCVQLEFVYSHLGQTMENTLWFNLHATPAEGPMLALGNAMDAWWTDNYAPLVSGNLQHVQTVITDMSSPTGPQVTLVPPVAEFGGQAGDAEPGNVSLTVSFRTASRGRSFRGRNYICGMTDVQVQGNVFATGIAASWADAYNAIGLALSALDVDWVVVSRFSGVDAETGDPIPREEGISTPVTVAVVVDNNVDSQRRRLNTRGN